MKPYGWSISLSKKTERWIQNVTNSCELVFLGKNQTNFLPSASYLREIHAQILMSESPQLSDTIHLHLKWCKIWSFWSISQWLFCICRTLLGSVNSMKANPWWSMAPWDPARWYTEGGCLPWDFWMGILLCLYIYIYIDSQADWLFTKQIGFEKNRERGNFA